MSSSNRSARKADWHEFYKNGIPKEVIVIDDDSPPPPQRRWSPQALSGADPRAPPDNEDTRHVDKRRRVDGATNYDSIYDQPSDYPPNPDESSVSMARTTSALYSTAPTSMDSTNSKSYQPRPDEHVGQKRKRPSRGGIGDEELDMEVIVQHRTWANYVPPPKPPIKATDVYVAVVRDVRDEPWLDIVKN